jgi:tetratricopeptide (TPR) repeat protein
MNEAQAELKAFEDINVQMNRRREAGAQMPDSYTQAALVKAQALVAIKNYPDAVKAFDAYLKVSPTDSDLLVQRGLLKAQLGDKKGAAADFRAALTYIPDYQPALDGLKQIGATR